MPSGDKSKYTDKQERKAQHIEESYERRGVSEQEAERRAWATVNKDDGAASAPAVRAVASRLAIPPHKGGRVGGAASAARSPARRSAAATKAAATRVRNAAHSFH